MHVLLHIFVCLLSFFKDTTRIPLTFSVSSRIHTTIVCSGLMKADSLSNCVVPAPVESFMGYSQVPHMHAHSSKSTATWPYCVSTRRWALWTTHLTASLNCADFAAWSYRNLCLFLSKSILRAKDAQGLLKLGCEAEDAGNVFLARR